MEPSQPVMNLEILSEQLGNSNSSIDQETTPEQKPKLREWEKHKAPWLAEMKLNQAKRTSTSPGPEQSKQKLQNSDVVCSTYVVKNVASNPSILGNQLEANTDKRQD